MGWIGWKTAMVNSFVCQRMAKKKDRMIGTVRYTVCAMPSPSVQSCFYRGYHQLHATCLFVSVSDNKVLSTLLALESQLDKLFASQDPTMPDDEVRFRAAVSDLADRELVITISWAKQVPGRCQLAPPGGGRAAGRCHGGWGGSGIHRQSSS